MTSGGPAVKILVDSHARVCSIDLKGSLGQLMLLVSRFLAYFAIIE